MRPLIYISISIPKNEKAEIFMDFVHKAYIAYDKLLFAGFAPVSPLLECVTQFSDNEDEETWNDFSLSVLNKCDFFVMIGKKTEFYIREVNLAIENRLKIFSDVEEALNWRINNANKEG
jgi:hypothetical protein